MLHSRPLLLLILVAVVFSPLPRTRAEAPQSVEPFPLSQVRLREGLHRSIQQRSARWILEIDPQRVLSLFRLNAQLPTEAEPLGGWESEGHVLRGAFAGHYLSICAQLYVVTEDPVFKERAEIVIAGLAECQGVLGDSGYLCAYPESAFDYAEAGEPGRQGISSVPYYTVHKIMRGLYEAHKYCHNRMAQQVLLKMARWADRRSVRLPEDRMQEFLNIEHGGMLEIFMDLYADTGEEVFLRAARRFEHRRIIDPLAQRDASVLLHLHGNSTVPKILGAARAYELLGNDHDRQVAEFFWDSVVNTRSYVTGNSTNKEHWGYPNQLAGELGTSTAESCVAHNMLKLTRRMFQWHPRAELMDYYERTLYGHILAAQHPTTGATMWYLPLESGYWKSYPSYIYLCCTGTLNESYASLADSIYFHNDTSLVATQFVASELKWPEKGLTLVQETEFPESPRIKFTVHLQQPVEFDFQLRIPGWATAENSLRLNGETVDFQPAAGSFYSLGRTWQDGDTVEVEFPMPLRAWPMPDDDSLMAFLAGPVVLAGQLGADGMTEAMIEGREQPHEHQPENAAVLVSESGEVSDLLKPVAQQRLTWQTTGQAKKIKFAPLYRVHGERYGVYWNVATKKGFFPDDEQSGIHRASIYRTELPAVGHDGMTTRVDLAASMHLAAQNLINGLDPDNNYFPRRAINLARNDGELIGSYDGCIPHHDIGRWWDALLRLEAATGYSIPKKIEEPLLGSTKRFFDNEFHVMLDPDRPDPVIDQHSYREHLLALNGLIQRRDSAWAREKSAQMIGAILAGRTPHKYPDHILSGRFIEALIRNYEITGNPDALRLAKRYAESHIDNVTAEDGEIPLEKGHTHSYLGTLRGLLLYGEISKQQRYVDRVLKTYQNGVTEKLIKKTGFTSHEIETQNGEDASSGDVAQLALWLATRHGQLDLLDDVERIVRARLLPSQVITAPPIKPRNDGKTGPVFDLTSRPDHKIVATADAFRGLNERIIGGYGGCHPRPHGWKTVTQDVTAAIIHTLVDIYQHIVVREENGLRILFHFDYADDDIEITSVRNKEAQLNILLKKATNLFVRIPGWVPRESVRVEVEGRPVDPEWQGKFLFLANNNFPAEVTLRYALPLVEETETTAGTEYHVVWRGDEVIGIRPNEELLPYYPSWTKEISVKESPAIEVHEQTHVDLKGRMELAGQNLVNMLHPQYDYLPSFLILVEPDYRFERHTFFMSHNIGRWIDAMYRLEDATGYAVPQHIQEAMQTNVRAYCDNSDDLFLRPLERFPHEEGDLMCFHSLREQLGALHALAKFKNDDWARDQALRMIAALDRLLLPEDQWRPQVAVWDPTRTRRYQEEGCTEVFWGWSNSLQGSEGRLIEPLLWIYQLTGDELALEMADRFARFHLEFSTRPSGDFYGGENLAGHNHSYMGTLRGLLYYGQVLGKPEYVDAVAKTYRKAIPRIVKHSGFTTHDLHRDHGGDTASAADVAQMALWLGIHHGHSECLDDVQRLVLSRLLPSQITETPPLKPKQADRTPSTMVLPDKHFAFVDYPEDVEQLIIGALGGIYGRAHGGKLCVTDVTSTVLSVLVDVYQHIVVENDQEVRINFHLDYENDLLRLNCVRKDKAHLSIDAKSNKPLLVRVPGWAPEDSVQLSVDGQTVPLVWEGKYLRVPKQSSAARVELIYDLPIEKVREKAGGSEFEITWRGDEIVGICPNTDFFPFFPTSSD
ncbi:MAG: glycoside hydrolase family 127 protein [Pirellulales bacterium]|nr:glycoside hydrolase family 127 protein [Pirellulales bacterium]